MDLETLYAAYKASRKHNKRSEDMVAFELDLYANLARLCNQINSKTYAPLHNYSFMHRRSQKPREVFAAEPPLKIMMAFALGEIAPLLEKRLSARTFNNRIGMGAQAAVNTLVGDIYKVSNGFSTPCWIIKVDYKGYFPNMLRDVAFDMVRDIVENDYKGPFKDDVLYCFKTACFCDPCHSVRKSALWEWSDYPAYKSVYCQKDGTGGFIGYTFWQAVASLYPTDIDNFVSENMTPYFVRYVDDTVMITDNKEMVLAMMPEYRKKLAEIGITMHPTKFYCQPCQHGVEFLGYHILPMRIHLKNRTIARAMGVAKSKERGKTNFIDAINSYLGMIKSTSDIKEGVKLLDAITRRGITKDYKNLKIS